MGFWPGEAGGGTEDKQDLLCDWGGVCTSLSLAGPKLAVGTEIRESQGYC